LSMKMVVGGLKHGAGGHRRAAAILPAKRTHLPGKMQSQGFLSDGKEWLLPKPRCFGGVE